MKNIPTKTNNAPKPKNNSGKWLLRVALVSFIFCLLSDLKVFAQQRVTYQSTESYDSLAGWQPYAIYRKKIDQYSNGRIIERLTGSAPIKASGFTMNEKIGYKYDAKGQVTEISYQFPSIYLADSFLGSRTETFQYNEAGKLTETQILVYDTSKKTYFPQNKHQYFYNASQQLIEIIRFGWDHPTQQLVELDRSQYFYNQAEQLIYQMDGNLRTDFAYDADGNESILTTRFYKSHKNYNAQKQLVLQLDSSYYAPKNKYIFHGFLENIYNAKGQLVQQTRHSESPDDGSDVPFYFNDHRFIYEYDENDSLKRETHQTGDRVFLPEPQIKWTNDGRVNYTYEVLPDNADSGFPEMFLYPNPTSGTAILTNLIEQGCAIKVDILDTKGRIVKAFTKKVTGYEQYHTQCRWELDLSNLSDGVYLVRLQNREGQYFTKKLLLHK
ncbi:T9SS type A sorting domain-containing protein [Emticicia agri]|nr:T9SS type A sorting domain-containing protein [Emticicia agri]